MKEARGQGLGQKGQANRGGHGQHHHQAKAPVDECRDTGGVVLAVGLREAGQQHGAQGHAQQCGGKLHEAIGIGEPRDAPGLEPRGNVGVDDQADLGH